LGAEATVALTAVGTALGYQVEIATALTWREPISSDAPSSP
jgi:hypothetical protein